VLKLNNNRWTCSCDITEVMQWLTETIPQAPAHRPVECLEGQSYRKLWSAAGGSQSCSVTTTTGALVGREREFTADMSVGLPTVSVPQSVQAVTHKTTQRIVESKVTTAGGTKPYSVSTITEALVGREREFTIDMSVDLPTKSVSVPQSVRAESETGGWASLLSWNVNTLCVLVILPITLGVAVFLSLIATNYITKKCSLRPSKHEIQRKDRHLAGFFSHAPLLNPQLTTDNTKHPGYVNRSSDSFSSTEYHVYERIE
jgi:hypothetical protein